MLTCLWFDLVSETKTRNKGLKFKNWNIVVAKVYGTCAHVTTRWIMRYRNSRNVQFLEEWKHMNALFGGVGTQFPCVLCTTKQAFIMARCLTVHSFETSSGCHWKAVFWMGFCDPLPSPARIANAPWTLASLLGRLGSVEHLLRGG